MFKNAYKKASKYTFPVIISSKSYDDKVQSGLGSFIILNEEGYFITCAHIFEVKFLHEKHSVEYQNYKDEIRKIENDTNLNLKAKGKRKSKLIFNNNWIINHSFWWGLDGINIESVDFYFEHDLAIGKFSNFNKSMCLEFPVLKDPQKIIEGQGTSLCKLGFPFKEVHSTFDNEKNSFKIDNNVFPIPRFPIDGIFTREIYKGISTVNNLEIKFIETSTPGLKGQSGGPIFDAEGKIWAIQSQTANLDLGFSPKIIKNGKEIVENQFLNVGSGIHIETICKILDLKKIKYQIGD